MTKPRLDYSFCLSYSLVWIYLLNGFVILAILFKGFYNGFLMIPSPVFTNFISYSYKLLGCMFLTEKSKKTALLQYTVYNRWCSSNGWLG